VSEVDALRAQLRDRGYLSHGIERWFALDPWSSRAFWVELATVAAKAATLIALFAALPNVTVMLIRNRPLSALEVLQMFVLYGTAWWAINFAIIAVTALLLKIRPALAVDTPGVLLVISIAVAVILIATFGIWWYGFDTPAEPLELIAGVALAAVCFLVASIVASAALLSFSIYEIQRVPAIHQKPRTVPLTVAAAILIVLLFVPASLTEEPRETPPRQVATTPTARRVALIAVDGLTFEIAQSRPDLLQQLPSILPVEPVRAASTTERWASVGTGVPAMAHGVRAVDAVRFRGGDHVLQSVSRADALLRALVPSIGLGRREPLPPTVRRRDFVWEIFAERGVPSLAANWWTSESRRTPSLWSIGQEEIFSRDPLQVDATASERFTAAIAQQKPQFATVYLPALDVVLNRMPPDQSRQLALSLRSLDRITSLIRSIRESRYDILLIGLPGDHATGQAVIGATFATEHLSSAYDVAPTLCALLGFPASEEMPGKTAVTTTQQRIATYGRRATAQTPSKLDQEYYESLRSLGYIR
jgi:hypothetical protein